jgi:cell fate regulator YaaT (PSP1 superfamily)
MAKEQRLSLNPTKISGQCGRLMCCLTFEHEMYKKIKEKFPKVGEAVKTNNGKGKVIRHNAIHNRIAIRLEGGQEIEASLDEIIHK